jgi:uncharacterized protein (TIGR00725 family)
MTEIRKKIHIGVIGGNKAGPEFAKQAYEIGRLIAQREAILICGGLGGVMQEAARGAKEAGGLTIGILPGMRAAEANPYIDIAIATGLGYTRNSLVAMNADIVIAVDGEYGTLSEIAFAHIYKKAVIGLGTWDIPGIIPVSTAEAAVSRALEELEKAR